MCSLLDEVHRICALSDQEPDGDAAGGMCALQVEEPLCICGVIWKDWKPLR